MTPQEELRIALEKIDEAMTEISLLILTLKRLERELAASKLLPVEDR